MFVFTFIYSSSVIFKTLVSMGVELLSFVAVLVLCGLNVTRHLAKCVSLLVDNQGIRKLEKFIRYRSQLGTRT